VVVVGATRTLGAADCTAAGLPAPENAIPVSTPTETMASTAALATTARRRPVLLILRFPYLLRRTARNRLSQCPDGTPDSAARLARGAPWLCVPFSRRVCLFVGSDIGTEQQKYYTAVTMSEGFPIGLSL
jgi:hypothetical protein